MDKKPAPLKVGSILGIKALKELDELLASDSDDDIIEVINPPPKSPPKPTGSSASAMVKKKPAVRRKRPFGEVNKNKPHPVKRVKDEPLCSRSASEMGDFQLMYPDLCGNINDVNDDPKASPLKSSSPSNGNGNEGQSSNQKNKKKARRASISSEQLEVPTDYVSKEKQKEAMKTIPDPENKALQKLLFNAKFQMKLFNHQFEAVRRCAGVPDNFPLHDGSEVKSYKNATMQQAICGLDQNNQEKSRRNSGKTLTKGLVLSDSMGLGKTVQAIAAAILCNAIAAAKHEKKMPTLIVSPNDAVQEQWKKTLIQNGVRPKNIVKFKVGRNREIHNTDNFVLLTRFTAQCEIKEVFNGRRLKDSPSPLFPNATEATLGRLRDEWKFENAKTPKERKKCRTWRLKGERQDDAITRHIFLSLKNIKKQKTPMQFRLHIVDEAHFIKNRLCQWTMAISLFGIHSLRNLALTGTPYNGGLSDLATLMTVIDCSKRSAQTAWWAQTLDETGHSMEQIYKLNHAWLKTYMLRRGKETIKHMLPKMTIAREMVHISTGDIQVYSEYESKCTTLLQKFHKALEADDPGSHAKLKNMFTMLMAVLANMRSSLIHPALCRNGRELTHLFSPSRRKMSYSFSKKCVCCSRKSGDGSTSNRQNADETREGEDEDDVGDDYGDDDDEEMVFAPDTRETFPIPDCFCEAGFASTKHYAHQECLDQLSAGHGICCPRCLDLRSRLEGGQKFYCSGRVKGYEHGFTSSPKLEAAVSWLLSIPEHEKLICVSFFKGSLDLVEAIMTYEHAWKCARFDGDVDPEEKSASLAYFQRDPSCRLLLMTVQSGGVGLNICEANHLLFLDRWFNPFVHAQAEDRIHRIGQQKDCTVAYLDVAATVDEAMHQLNIIKKNNATVLLGDGYELGEENSNGNLSYTELSGLIREMLLGIQAHRATFPPDGTPIPAFEGIESLVASHSGATSAGGSTEQESVAESKPMTGKDGLEDAVYEEEDNEDKKSASALPVDN